MQWHTDISELFSGIHVTMNFFDGIHVKDYMDNGCWTRRERALGEGFSPCWERMANWSDVMFQSHVHTKTCYVPSNEHVTCTSHRAPCSALTAKYGETGFATQSNQFSSGSLTKIQQMIVREGPHWAGPSWDALDLAGQQELLTPWRQKKNNILGWNMRVKEDNSLVG